MFRLPLFRIRAFTFGNLVGAKVLDHLTLHGHALLTGRSFFPQLISAPFRSRPARGVRVRDRRLPGRRGGLVLTRSPSVRAARRRTIEWGRALGFAPIRADRRLAFGGLRARGRPALE
jgi:hypothetical protein